jgi:LacI family transcriptional regulator
MKAQAIRSAHRPCLSIVLQLQRSWDFAQRIYAGVGRYLADNRNWPVRVRRVDMSWRPGDADAARDDGIITQIRDHDHAQRLIESGFPAVNVTGMGGVGEPMPAVLTDFARAGEMAAEFLLGRGYRHFATGIACSQSAHTELTYAGFVRHLEREGFDCRRLDREFTVDSYAGPPIDTARSIIRTLPHQTALLFAIDWWSEWVIDAAELEGIAIPEDLAIMGIGDDRQYSELSRPQLTSVNMAFAERGYAAMQALRRLMDGQSLDPPTQLIEPRGVIERQSTRLVVTSDPQVLTAIRFIHEHADVPITVEDVMECVTCSRRTLEQRFQRELGNSIHHAIWHAHVELAKRMLIETDLELIEIAHQTGFASRSTFNNVFKSRTAMTPMQFRRSHRTMTER